MCPKTGLLDKQLIHNPEAVFAHAKECKECRIVLLRDDVYPPGCHEPLEGYYVLLFLDLLAEGVSEKDGVPEVATAYAHLATCEICRCEVADAAKALGKHDFQQSASGSVPSAGRSMTVVTYPIVAALVEAEKMLRMSGRKWDSQNDQQRIFLENHFPSRCDIDSGVVRCIQSVADWNAEVINAFLRAHGFSMTLPPFAPHEFGVASVLDLLVQWVEKGERREIVAPDRATYQGVRIYEDHRKFFAASGHANPIVGVLTKDRMTTVYMTVADHPPESATELAAIVARLSREKRRDYPRFGGVVFPMVDLDEKADISWIERLTTFADSGIPVCIQKALQQTRLRMNEFGARAESAVALDCACIGGSFPDPVYIIDKPFLVWIEQVGLREPLFIGYIAEDTWKDPGGLGDISPKTQNDLDAEELDSLS